MDDAALVGRLECVGDLTRDRQCLVEWKGAPQEAVCECVTLHQLEHQRTCGATIVGSALFETVDGRDVGVRQRGEHLRLALETRQPIAVGRKDLRDDLEGHVAPEPRVPRPIDLPHPALAEKRGDFVDAEAGARGQHGGRPAAS